MSNHLYTGGCACGKFRFEARGEPHRIGICHCLTCRKAHGALFNFYAVFPAEAVRFEGETLAFASSERGRRYACASCGSPAYSTYGRADEIYLYPGSFDEPELWRPEYELWTRRREPWLPPFASVIHRYAQNRPKWRQNERD
jgi:hypothetical protein